jgi:penicillin-binding protein 1C
MLQAMLEVERPGVDASWREFAAPRRVAWKTGTSFGFRDAWAIGVTPRFAVGIWAGNTGGEGRPGLTGFGAAAPILFDVFDTLPSSGWFRAPARDLVPVTVCRHSGQRAGPACRDTEIIEVPRAGLEGHPCTYCQVVHLDQSGTHRVHSGCEPVHAMKTVERFVLPPGIEWFYRMRHADYAPMPPWRSDCTSALGNGAASLSIIYPKPDTAVYVPIELDGKRGRTVLEAAHRDPRATIYWHLDDQYLGLTRDIHQMAVAPAPGSHVLTLVDDTGERLERRFTVLDKPRNGAQ